MALYGKRDVAMLSRVDQTLEQYSGKEVELWVKLHKKYGEAVVLPTCLSEEERRSIQGAYHHDEEEVATSCFGGREPPGERQRRMEEEVATQKADESISGCVYWALDSLFGAAPGPGEVPTQYPWVTVAYIGCHFWCLCCTYLLVLYGIEFEESVGHAWLLSSLTSLSIDIIINEPAFLLVSSIIVSVWTVYAQQNIRSMGMED